MPRTKSVRKTTKTATVKKTKKSSVRKSVKKKPSPKLIKEKDLIDEKPKKRRRTTRETKTKKKRAKKTEIPESELIEGIILPNLEGTKVKVSTQVTALKEKLENLKMKMQEILMEKERKQEELSSLESENFRLQSLLKLKGEDVAKLNEEIISLRTKADVLSSKYDASIKAKQIELEKCLGDIKRLQQNLLISEGEQKKLRNFFEETLKNERISYSELKQKLKKAEDAYREGQINVVKVQNMYEQSIEKFHISQKKLTILVAELEGERKEKFLLESDLNKIYAHVGAFVKKLESELKRVRMLREKDDSKDNEQTVLKTNIFQQGVSEKPDADSRVDDITSRLEAAWNAVNDERDFLRSKLMTQGIDTKGEVQSNKNFMKIKLSTLEGRYRKLIFEKKGLEAKVNSLSSDLQKLESKVKVMGMTIREGTKGRKKLRQMLDDAKRGKAKAESDLLTRERHHSKQIQELRSKLVDLEAISKANPVKTNVDHEVKNSRIR